jgi:prepilin-type N-terminal cleavage/methylation domain-containing protein
MADRPTLVNERGFTLAELLIVSAILGMIMLGVLTVQRQGVSAYLIGAARVEVQQNARAGLDTMLNEIRSALTITAVPAGCGTGPVPTGGGGTTISITEQGGTAVQYQLVGSNLQRNGVVLVGGVQTLRIWCYDSTDALTSTAANVRTVHMRIGTQTESAVTANADRNQHALMETRVRLRNL